MSYLKRRRILTACLLLLFLLLLPSTISRAAIYPKKYQVPETTEQLVVVKYKKKSKGTLYYYVRNSKGEFKKKFSCTAYLGRKGINKKKEGDGKSPTGLYPLEQGFGILKNPGTKMPYLKVNSKYYWCSDSNSRYYNQLIRIDKTKHKCKGEHLYKYKGYYDYAISIGYNSECTPKLGSAIFLHCSKKKATGGCVAIDKKYMKKLLKYLDPEKNPMILIDKF